MDKLRTIDIIRLCYNRLESGILNPDSDQLLIAHDNYSEVLGKVTKILEYSLRDNLECSVGQLLAETEFAAYRQGFIDACAIKDIGQ